MPNNFIPPHKADELNKLLGLPPREKPKKRTPPGMVRLLNPDGTEGELRVEGLPDPFADVTDPKLKKKMKKLHDDAMGSFDPREY